MKTADFVRSEQNKGAILNVDNSSLAAYKRNREIMRNMRTHEERLQKVENSLEDIKGLLLKLLENGNNK